MIRGTVNGWGGVKTTPPVDIALLVGNHLWGEITWHNYKLTYMIEIGPKIFMMMSLF